MEAHSDQSLHIFFRRTNRRYGSIMIHESSQTDRIDSRNKSIRDIFVFFNHSYIFPQLL